MASTPARLAALLTALTLFSPTTVAAQPERIVVHATDPVGPSNQRLGGIGWNAGSLDGVAPLEPHQIRIDAGLEHASVGPDALDLGPLLEKMAAVRDIGAEPLVILSYMPAWLGEPNAHGRDPTRVAPADLDRWEELVTEVVRSLATAPAPAYRFEVWNEPDVPVFWQDTPAAFVKTALRTHRAVATVRAETDLPLEVGGPVTAFPDPAYMLPYFAAVRAARLPLDFVSWHYYGNYPFLGPDGSEGFVPEPVMLAWGQRNPLASPAAYRYQTELVRSWVDAAFTGSSYGPRLEITEWNLSAGGLDVRHDTHEGAAFDAATLIEMERVGLDAADVYRAADAPGDPRPGDWGLVGEDGNPKPAWWVFDAWRRTAGDRLATSGDTPQTGLWARATSGPGRVDVLIASFLASGGVERDATIHLEGACADEAVVRVLDAASSDLDAGERRTVSSHGFEVAVPAQSVTWVRFETECP